MAQSHDLHHECYHSRHPSLPMPNKHTKNVHNDFDRHNNNHSVYTEGESREYMEKIKYQNTNK